MQLVGQKGPLTGMVLAKPLWCNYAILIYICLLIINRFVIHGFAQGKLFVQVLKNEGTRSMYLGLAPALTRSVLYGGLRLGLYEPSKNVCNRAFGSTNMLVKIASGAFSGGIATALTNPVEVLKVMLSCQLYFDFSSEI